MSLSILGIFLNSLPFILSGLVIVLCSLYFYITRNFNYWKIRNIPYAKPIPFFGSLYNTYTIKCCLAEDLADIYNKHKDEPIVGLFMIDQPALSIQDPELIKNILVKEFDHFNDRSVAENHKDDPIASNMLFLIKNPVWKELRRKITPVFTSGKLRLMYKLISDSADDLINYLQKSVEKDPIVETREVCAKYTTDTISSTSFGIKAHCFENEDADFRIISRNIFNFQSLSRGISSTLYFISPELVKLFHLKFLDGFCTEYLRNVFWKTIEEREKTNIVRNDLLDIIIEMKRNAKSNEGFNLEGDTIVAQATQFFVAGYETSSSVVSFALYELAKNQKIQDTLRQEINEAYKNNNNALSYDVIKSMPFLEQVFQETLRMYPVLPFLDRKCTLEYKVPNSNVVIEKGTAILIPIFALQNDPKYFPNPKVFDPTRFNEENIKSRHAFAHIPFGEGPRNCIGARYGALNSKLGIAAIIKHFKVEPLKDTPEVMSFNPKAFLLGPVKDLKLKFVKI